MKTAIVLMIDGLSRQMLDSVHTPNFARLRAEGASTDRLEPVFPSISEPNWVSASTGCWPQVHGIVSGVFVDPRRGLFNHDVDADWICGGELLHRAAERQGIRSAVLGWYGRYSRSQGKQATYVSNERKVPWTLSEYANEAERTDQVVSYLEMAEAERPGLILAYFAQPDEFLHDHGMASTEARNSVARADAQIGRLLDVISRVDFHDEVTLFVMSDHGHLPVTRLINTHRILRRHGIRARYSSTATLAFLYLNDKSQTAGASAALGQYAEFDVYTRDRQPDWAHLGDGDRVGDLILSAHVGYYFVAIEQAPWFLRPLGTFGSDTYPSPFLGQGNVSTHGYPPQTPGMQGIFYAWGAGIGKGIEIPQARMIDVHPTVARSLGIAPGKPLDGTALPLQGGL